jgi:hypothetical protein
LGHLSAAPGILLTLFAARWRLPTVGLKLTDWTQNPVESISHLALPIRLHYGSRTQHGKLQYSIAIIKKGAYHAITQALNSLMSLLR